MKRIALIIGLMTIFSLIMGCGTVETEMESQDREANKNYTHISTEEAMERMTYDDGHFVVDVRTREEFAQGHIPNAFCIPNEEIGTEMPEELPDLDQIIYVYCSTGRRSAEAAGKLAKMGYTNIYDFGGIVDWTGDVIPG